MSDSELGLINQNLLEMLFNVKGYIARGIKQTSNRRKVIIELEQTFDSRCPRCGKNCNESRYDSKYQEIYIGSIHCKSVYGKVKVWRVKCPDCGVLTDRQKISEGKRRYSKQVSKTVVKYTKLTDNESVSKLLGISPSTVFRIDKEELSKLMENYIDKIPEVYKASVDEVSRKRKHHYATVISDQIEGKVLWVEKGRTSKSLSKGYQKLHPKLKNLKSISMDFWAAYKKATMMHYPKAKIIYDRFHLSRIFNRYIEEERRDYQRDLPDSKRKYIKKNLRWLLLRRKNNFKDTHIKQFERLKKDNEKLYELYLLKEKFLSIFDENHTRKKAKKLIINWVNLVKQLTHESIKNFAKRIMKRLENVLNYFDDPISNGKAEGINNVIKTLLKRAYGYKDFEYLRMKILQKCGFLMNGFTHTF